MTPQDKSIVAIRRLDKRDFDAVLALHKALTAREQYLRFFTANPTKHLEKLADALIQRDRGHYALGAFDAERLVGVANYVLSNDPTVADVAVAVAHDHQSQGVATTLLRRLGEVARRKGIRFFVADVLAENHEMLRVLRDAGWLDTTLLDSSVLRIQVELANIS